MRASLLQSRPSKSRDSVASNGADGGTRTHDLTITNRLRYQLRHVGKREYVFYGEGPDGEVGNPLGDFGAPAVG